MAEVHWEMLGEADEEIEGVNDTIGVRVLEREVVREGEMDTEGEPQ